MKKFSAVDFVYSIVDLPEYIKGENYKEKYRGMYIPVVEYNELIEAANKFDNKKNRC